MGARLIAWQAVQRHSTSGSDRATARLNCKDSTAVPLVPILSLNLISLRILILGFVYQLNCPSGLERCLIFAFFQLWRY